MEADMDQQRAETVQDCKRKPILFRNSESEPVPVGVININNCLICGREDSLLLSPKKEIPGQTTQVISSEYGYGEESTSNTNATFGRSSDSSDSNNNTKLNTLCKLLNLSQSSTLKLTSHEEILPGSKITFCTNCYEIITNVTQLFGQIQKLQNMVEDIKNYVESLVNSSYSKHIGEKYSSHRCNLKSCSEIDKLRRVIITDTKRAMPKKKNEITLDFEPLKLKQLSVDLIRLTEQQIQNMQTSYLNNSYNNEDSQHDIELDTNDPFDNFNYDFDQFLVETTEPISYISQQATEDQTRSLSLDQDHMTQGLELGHPQESFQCKTEKSKPKQTTPQEKKKKEKAFRLNKERLPRRVRKSKPNSFSCPDPNCDEVFPYKCRLNEHIIKSHDVKKFTVSCSRCGKRFTSEEALGKHLSSQGGTCLKNPLNENCIILTEGPKKFMCTICGQRTVSRNKFEEHYHTHSKIKKFMCDICGQKVSRKVHLVIHKRTFHPQEPGIEPFRCSFEGCDKHFALKSRLLEHEKEHRGEFDFLCSECDFRTVALYLLNKHVAVHSKEKPWKCEHCGCAYRRKDKWQRHVWQNHTNPEDRPYKCKYCDKTFAESFKLKRHQIIHTGEKPKKCTICGKQFAVNDYLRIHMKTHEDKSKPVKSEKSSPPVVTAKKSKPKIEVLSLPSADIGQSYLQEECMIQVNYTEEGL